MVPVVMGARGAFSGPLPAARVTLVAALLAQVFLGRPSIRSDLRGHHVRLIRLLWPIGLRVTAETGGPGVSILAETSSRRRVTGPLAAAQGEPAQPQMAVARVFMTEPPGDEHANPDRHDGDVQDRAAHGPSPRCGRYRAGDGPPGDRSRTRISPGPKRARRVCRMPAEAHSRDAA